MIRIPKQGITDEAVLKVVDEWIRVLAAGDYQTAYEMTYHPKDDHLTPALTERLIRTYTTLKEPADSFVTLPGETKLPSDTKNWTPDREVNLDLSGAWDNREEVGRVEYTLPLNGLWSDVTAIFTLLDQGDHLVLQLYDLHVM